MALPSGCGCRPSASATASASIGVRFADGTGAAKTMTRSARGVGLDDTPSTHDPVHAPAHRAGAELPRLRRAAPARSRGLQADGALWLEDGARLAVVKGTCKTLDPAKGFVWQYAAEPPA